MSFLLKKLNKAQESATQDKLDYKQHKQSLKDNYKPSTPLKVYINPLLCVGITQSGSSCNNNKQIDTDFCHLHQP